MFTINLHDTGFILCLVGAAAATLTILFVVVRSRRRKKEAAKVIDMRCEYTEAFYDSGDE